MLQHNNITLKCSVNILSFCASEIQRNILCKRRSSKRLFHKTSVSYCPSAQIKPFFCHCSVTFLVWVILSFFHSNMELSFIFGKRVHSILTIHFVQVFPHNQLRINQECSFRRNRTFGDFYHIQS